MARPWPVREPAEFLIFESALCPQITPGIPAKIEKQTKLNMPSTRLQMASAEVFGCDEMGDSDGGIVSFINFNSGNALAVKLADAVQKSNLNLCAQLSCAKSLCVFKFRRYAIQP